MVVMMGTEKITEHILDEIMVENWEWNLYAGVTESHKMSHKNSSLKQNVGQNDKQW